MTEQFARGSRGPPGACLGRVRVSGAPAETVCAGGRTAAPRVPFPMVLSLDADGERVQSLTY